MMGSLLREWTERKADADDARGIVAGASRGVNRTCASGAVLSRSAASVAPRPILVGPQGSRTLPMPWKGPTRTL